MKPETDGAGLLALEREVRRDLERLQEPAEPWVPPRYAADGTRILDVVIVGAGMAGLALAASLARDGVDNVLVVDRSEPDRAGPWATYARMPTLRSPKHLAGPAIGLPSLTFRAWHEARFGAAAWDELDRIPRLMWNDYLNWYRDVMGIRVTSRTALSDLAGDGDGLSLTLTDANAGTEGVRHVRSRLAVLAMGRDGLGGPRRPPLYAGLPPRLVAHTSDFIDFAALAGRRVGVIGVGSSAFDNAGAALEAGASVTMLARRPDIPRVNKTLGANHAGYAKGYADLPAGAHREMEAVMAAAGVPPPRPSVLRCSRHEAFALRVGCTVAAAREEAGRVVLETSHGRLVFDVLILATGFAIDWSLRPELARLAARAARSGEGPPNAAPPALGPGMEFCDDDGDPAAWPARVYCLNNTADPTHGRIAGDIPGISVGAGRVAEHIVRRLFVEDWPAHLDAIRRFDRPELIGDEWVTVAPTDRGDGHS
ncbi:FAD-dependent oxidoreductase [Acuticoccus mangrovi]|uniref:NAD(P)/FAD-dependent oxidoreductase n=1 Tax=Acuticoccus mangrovi TaxID=2796142 RepID=A0A934IMG6_9HYPH|nr:NAD(P)/FAD-dependent oxidoreductase [Acuticoccus mangrovi]